MNDPVSQVLGRRGRDTAGRDDRAAQVRVQPRALGGVQAFTRHCPVTREPLTYMGTSIFLLNMRFTEF